MRILNLFILFQICAVLTSCKQSNSTVAQVVDIQQVGPAEFEKLMSTDDVVVLDVRTPDEIAGGKINGALTIDYRGDKFEGEIAKLDKSKTYLVYCKSGGRSGKSCNHMKEQGFGKLTNLEGGYDGWKEYQKTKG